MHIVLCTNTPPFSLLSFPQLQSDLTVINYSAVLSLLYSFSLSVSLQPHNYKLVSQAKQIHSNHADSTHSKFTLQVFHRPSRQSWCLSLCSSSNSRLDPATSVPRQCYWWVHFCRWDSNDGRSMLSYSCATCRPLQQPPKRRLGPQSRMLALTPKRSRMLTPSCSGW
jgi:hypothetical protein